MLLQESLEKLNKLRQKKDKLYQLMENSDSEECFKLEERLETLESDIAELETVVDEFTISEEQDELYGFQKFQI